MVAPGAGVPGDEVATRVVARLDRSKVLTNTIPAQLLVLLGVSALTQGIGGRDVMLAQLEHLLDMAARPNIELRVIPHNCGWHPGLESAFALIESRLRIATSVVFIGTRRSALMLHEESDVRAYRQAIDHIVKVALQPDVSARLIADIHNRMEKHHDN